MKAREVYVQAPNREGTYRLRRATLPAAGRDALREQLERLARLAGAVPDLERRLPAKGGRR